jgi:intracellular multiplication protein IcmO
MSAYDDEGKQKPPGPDHAHGTTSATASQQHGYLTMQFTRSLQSLGDDYGYIFEHAGRRHRHGGRRSEPPHPGRADPGSRKITDEIANLGKIVVRRHERHDGRHPRL